MKIRIICMVAIACMVGSLNAAVVVIDDFESYALGTNLDGGGGGWSTDEPYNSNHSSPDVGDDTVNYGTTGTHPEGCHQEISEQFLRFNDNNSYASTAETLSRDLGVTLNDDGDYIQTAMYLNQYQDDAETAGNGVFMLKLQNSSSGNLATIAMAYRQFQGGSTYTPLRPAYHTWYFLRATLKDADDDGVIDSWDFDVYNADMTHYTGLTGLSLGGNTDGVHIQFAGNGSSAKGIALVDEITVMIPEPATVVLLTLGSLLLGRRKH